MPASSSAVRVADKNPMDTLGVMLPVKPVVLVEIERLARDPDFDIKDLAAVIACDPGLMAVLFRLSRSPAYSRGRRPESVEQILMMVGVKQTLNLIRGILLKQSLQGEAVAMHHFWERCDDIAALAALIAEDCVSVCNVFPDQAYLAAMFHDCGVPLLAARFPDYWARLRLADAAAWVDTVAENAHYSLDHATVGYWVARHWGLPDLIADAILLHHEMPSDDRLGLRSTIGIIALATFMHLKSMGVKDPAWLMRGPEVLEELGIHPGGFDEYIADVSERHVSLVV